MKSSEWSIILWFGTILLGLPTIGGCWAYPHYKVWSQGMEGQASLKRAEQEKQIQIEQAKAELESAKLRAQAIAEMGQAAKEYPEYRQQEFIGAFAEAVREGKIDQMIYVPTEANIPITEARPVPIK